jgi:hypothetical protein
MTLLETPRQARQQTVADGDVLRPVTWGAAVLAGLGWLPFVGAPASPDEGGYLLVASQWSRGTSLYGNYWVDRPPLLIGVHELAVALLRRLNGRPRSSLLPPSLSVLRSVPPRSPQ